MSSNPTAEKRANELYLKIIAFIRCSEQKKFELGKGFLATFFIPAKTIFTINSRNRSLDLLRLFLFNSIIGEESRIIIDSDYAEVINVLINSLEAQEEHLLNAISFLVPIVSAPYIILSLIGFAFAAANQLIFPVIVGFLIATLLYNYITYIRVRGKLKDDYKQLKKEITNLVVAD